MATNPFQNQPPGKFGHWVERLVHYKWSVAIVLAAFIGASVLIWVKTTPKTPRSIKTHAEASTLVQELDTGPTHSLPTPERMQKLGQVMEAHPEIYKKYDAVVTQILLNHKEIELARSYMQQAIQRLKEQQNNNYYLDYSEITQSIANHDFNKALDLSKNLSRLLSKEIAESSSLLPHRTYQTLYALNLLTMIGLYEKMEEEQNKIATTKKLLEFVKDKKELQKQLLLVGKEPISFYDYLQNQTSSP